MLFGGLMAELGMEETHVPMELMRDDPAAAELLIKRHYPYDWCFVVPFQTVMEDLPRLVRECPIVAWMSDDQWRYSSFGRYWKPFCHTIVTTDLESAERYGEKGHLSNWGCRKSWAGNTMRQGVIQAPEFGFAGQMYGDRLKKWEAVRTAGNVRGRLFQTNGASCSADDYFDRMAGSAFSLCLTASSSGVPQMKSRLFEPQLCGSILVTEPVPGLDRYWTDGEDCVVFHSPKEAQECMSELLANPEMLTRMQIRAYDRALSEHTYNHRFRPILERLGLGGQT